MTEKRGGIMADIEVKTVYFENEGRENTDKTIDIALKRAKQLDISQIVVASTTGYTGLKAADKFKGYEPIIVTHSTGFKKPNEQSLSKNDREKLKKKGARVLTAQHAFGGAGRAVRKKLGTYEVEEIIAYTLRTFGEGMKVVCEIVLMAADAGLIRTDREAISIAGTAEGADTAVVVKPANVQTFFDMEVREILCKPRLG